MKFMLVGNISGVETKPIEFEYYPTHESGFYFVDCDEIHFDILQNHHLMLENNLITFGDTLMIIPGEYLPERYFEQPLIEHTRHYLIRNSTLTPSQLSLMIDECERNPHAIFMALKCGFIGQPLHPLMHEYFEKKIFEFFVDPTIEATNAAFMATTLVRISNNDEVDSVVDKLIATGEDHRIFQTYMTLGVDSKLSDRFIDYLSNNPRYSYQIEKDVKRCARFIKV